MATLKFGRAVKKFLTSVPRFEYAVGEALRHSPAAMPQGAQRWLAAAAAVRTDRRHPYHVGCHPGSRVFVATGKGRRFMEFHWKRNGVNPVINPVPHRFGTLLI